MFRFVNTKPGRQQYLIHGKFHLLTINNIIRKFSAENKPLADASSNTSLTTTATDASASETTTAAANSADSAEKCDLLKTISLKPSVADITLEAIKLKNFFPGLRNEPPPLPLNLQDVSNESFSPPSSSSSSLTPSSSTSAPQPPQIKLAPTDIDSNRKAASSADDYEWILDSENKVSSAKKKTPPMTVGSIQKDDFIPPNSTVDESSSSAAGDPLARFLQRMPTVLHQSGAKVVDSIGRVAATSLPPYLNGERAPSVIRAEQEIRKRLDDALEQRKAAQKQLMDIPGPAVLKAISRIWNVVPFVGSQLSLALYRSLLNAEQYLEWYHRAARPSEFLFRRYGSIIHLAGPFGGNILLISKPAHMAIVLRSGHQVTADDSSFTVATPIIDCIAQYRSLESIKFVLQKSIIPRYFYISFHFRRTDELPTFPVATTTMTTQPFDGQGIDVACEHLVRRLASLKNRRHELAGDIVPTIQKWSFECAGQQIFGKHFVGFLATSVSVDEAERLYAAVLSASDAIGRCERGPQMWRTYQTPAWRKLVVNMKVIDR